MDIPSPKSIMLLVSCIRMQHVFVMNRESFDV